MRQELLKIIALAFGALYVIFFYCFVETERLHERRLATNPWEKYASLAHSWPLIVGVITAVTLGVGGDYIAQFKEAQFSCTFRYNTQRGTILALFTGLYSGIFQYFFFKLLLTVTPSAQNTAKVWERAVVLASASQFGAVPFIYYPLFFACIGAVRRHSLPETLKYGRNMFCFLYKRSLSFWIPLQIIQFAVVPPELHVPFMCVAGLFWNAVLSSLALRSRHDGATGPTSESNNLLTEINKHASNDNLAYSSSFGEGALESSDQSLLKETRTFKPNGGLEEEYTVDV